MIFNFEIGKIYDTIFYGVLQFQKAFIFEKWKEYQYSQAWIDRLDRTFAELQEEADEPMPSILSPFFLNQKEHMCALAAFYVNQIDYTQDTFDSFLEKLKANPDLLFSYLVDIIFFDSPFGDPSSLTLPLDPAVYVKAVDTSSYPQEVKLQIALLVGNYSYAFSLLVEHLQRIHKRIDALHSAHAKEIADAAEGMQQQHYLELYKQRCEHVTSSAFQKELPIYASITVLHSVFFRMTSCESRYTVDSGILYEEAVRLLLAPTNDWRKIFCALGSEIRFSILDVMSKRVEMTVSEVSRALGIPTSTAFVHMDDLYHKNVLLFSRKKGMQTFYKINYPVLRNAFRLAGNFFDEREKGSGAGE